LNRANFPRACYGFADRGPEKALRLEVEARVPFDTSSLLSPQNWDLGEIVSRTRVERDTCQATRTSIGTVNAVVHAAYRSRAAKNQKHGVSESSAVFVVTLTPTLAMRLRSPFDCRVLRLNP